jgi:hypothetical protein
MSHPSTIKKSLAALCLAAGIALTLWLVLASSSGAGESPAPVTIGAPNACAATQRPPVANVVRTVFGTGPQGPEVTERAADGAYQITRCNERGALVVRQLVVPVSTPDGPRMIAAETATPTEVISGLVPADYNASPDLLALWKEQGATALKSVLPPTPEPSAAEDAR